MMKDEVKKAPPRLHSVLYNGVNRVLNGFFLRNVIVIITSSLTHVLKIRIIISLSKACVFINITDYMLFLIQFKNVYQKYEINDGLPFLLPFT